MEHRQHPRFPVRFRSSFLSANLVSGDGDLQDLSIRGCKVVTSVELQPGTALELRIEASDEALPLCVSHAVVRWHRNGTCGMEFIGLAPDEWTRLQHLVKELEMDPVNISLITDYDTGVEGVPLVSHEEVIKVFTENNEKLRKLLFRLIELMPAERASNTFSNVLVGSRM